jgi:hypothetical protein
MRLKFDRINSRFCKCIYVTMRDTQAAFVGLTYFRYEKNGMHLN